MNGVQPAVQVIRHRLEELARERVNEPYSTGLPHDMSDRRKRPMRRLGRASAARYAAAFYADVLCARTAHAKRFSGRRGCRT